MMNGISVENRRFRQVKLEEPIIEKFRPWITFVDANAAINAIDFSPDGTRLVSSANDSIKVINCVDGTLAKNVQTDRTGARLLQFTHLPGMILHTSRVTDHGIRRMEIETGVVVDYLEGHEDKILSLRSSTTKNLFLSTALDNTLRLWDMRLSECLGVMTTNGHPIGDFDPQTLIFAVGLDSEQIKLYDVRMFNRGPFEEFMIPEADRGTQWTSLKFSPDGQKILIPTRSSKILLVDAFSGQVLHRIDDYCNERGMALEASFSPDGRFVFSGSSDGFIHVWDSETGRKVVSFSATFSKDHPIRCLKFNPGAMMLSSTCLQTLTLWTPPVGSDI